MSKVLITVKKGGNVSIKVEGVPGGNCRVASEPYVNALAGQTVSDEPTDEMNQVPTVDLDQAQQMGS